SNGAKGHGRKHRPRPGAEILGGHVRTTNLAQIGIHIRGVDGATNTFLVYMLKEMLPGKILDCPHDAGDAAVFYPQPPGFPALALEVKAQLRTLHVEVGGAKRRQTVSPVLFRIFSVADT